MPAQHGGDMLREGLWHDARDTAKVGAGIAPLLYNIFPVKIIRDK